MLACFLINNLRGKCAKQGAKKVLRTKGTTNELVGEILSHSFQTNWTNILTVTIQKHSNNNQTKGIR